jgi:protein involved in polysaccharide export with SLBB domain
LTSGTDNSDNGITDAANAALSYKKTPLRIPALTVNANLPPYVTDYRIGDRVAVKITGHPTVSDINGMYRIEKRTIEVDDNDNETVTLEVSL